MTPPNHDPKTFQPLSFLASSYFQLRVCSGFGEKKMRLHLKQNSTTETLRVRQQARKKHKHALWYFGCGPNMTKLLSGRLLGTCIHLGLCTFSFLTFLVYEGRLICLCRLSRPSFEGWSKHCYCQTTKTKPKFKPSQLPAPLCHLLWAPGSGWAPGLSPGSVDCVHL